MSADGYFRVSVIQGALELVRYQQRYPELSLAQAIRQLRAGPPHLAGYDYVTAIELAERAGWDVFRPHPDRQVEFRNTLLRLAVRLSPLWTRLAPHGREVARQALGDNLRQCLGYAGVLDGPPTEEVVAWWDHIAATVRDAEDQARLVCGRRGEQLSLAYERVRLDQLGLVGYSPEWVSVEDNGAGYDIRSYDCRDIGQILPIQIEVKTSTRRPTRFFISRHEWETALARAPHYRFHVWCLADESLQVYTVPDLTPHMPCDFGLGRWTDAELILQR